jgi:hypothetical protein
METEAFPERTGIRNEGVRLVAPELLRRVYKLTVMPNHNAEFDGIKTLPRGTRAISFNAGLLVESITYADDSVIK